MTEYTTEIAQDGNGCWQAMVYASDDPVPVDISLPYGGRDGKRKAEVAAKWFVEEGKVRKSLF